ncbi:MAG: YIP1 family protein [Persicimonas sp.]
MDHARHRRQCVHHEAAPAVAICTECGGDVCAACHGSDLRGYCVCAVCREKFAPPTTPWEDPNQEYSPAAFAQTLREVVTSPRSFFQKVRFSDSWLPAIAFGAICMAVGLLSSTSWQFVFFEQANARLAEVATQFNTSVQTVKMLSFVSVPFRVLIGLAVHVGVFHLALKLAGGRTSRAISARIVGYASAGYAFLLIPPIGEFALGHFLAIIWIFNLEAGAIRAYFGLGIWRALAVVMATLLLMLPFVA